ncbi:MAG: penicillin acylase [Arenimonas sp. SCN 70-307]|uniref:penicillin acylase family protein n=1 Tax=Arenimonas sp. SCN 70-307 TaxID=1660089 RepID=UPI00086981A5|nr:penicillin acylase family protein [Arenimonas sp. SCN 70-307]ODS63972.1 MAG: penicillin acylase [Arenimonas sp. SCN 70-307]
MRKAVRLTVRLLAVLVILAVLAMFAGLWAMRVSLPALEGELQLAGLSAPVLVSRDERGIATLEAANEADAARALGFVHAQERYFEMDLLRRSAAGELSALFGPIAIERDKEIRVHRLRARLAEHLGQATDGHLAALEAYRDGVNDGLLALQARPWPYLLLRAQPEPWTLEDTMLAGYAMFFDLQDESNSRELALWRIREVVPPALYDLIAVDGSEWDAPLVGGPRGNAVLPGPEQVDLRELPMPEENGDYAVSEPAAPGSNNFAVAGSRTADGRAIVANDMHLGLRAPNIWFRARLRYPDARAPGGQVDVSGFTLPGIPAVIVGSNGHVAWGFTNSYGDWLDFYRVEFTDAERLKYRVPGGEAALRTDSEWIAVKGGEPVELKVRETRWGPITVDLDDGSALALRWTAQLPGSLNFGLAHLARAGGLDEGLAVADEAGIPAQNLVMADRSGRIAWRITGQIPQRSGDCQPRAPLRVEQACRWTGWLPPTENPSVVDPADGVLWTANARVVDGEALAIIGDAGYANGARARQIRDVLRETPRFTEADLLALQLDDRALFLQRWHALLQAEAGRNPNSDLRALAEASANWTGRASVDAADYRIVRAWRLAVIERISNGLMAPAQAALGEAFVMPDLPQAESFAWPLVQQRPAHLLPRKFDSWESLLADAARDIRAQLEERGPLAERTWGERNTAAICHPLAGALGPLGKLLCMPAEPLRGDGNMPLVQGPGFGASERMVVSPGREAEGFAHMPGGQSGHPMSPFWGAGHADWVRGEPSPFLPGEARHQLRLVPEL